MSKAISVTISFDDEKLMALQTYLEQKDSTVEKELSVAMEQIYTKHVPVAVREYIGMKAGVPPSPSVPKSRKKKPMATADTPRSPLCSPEKAQTDE